MRKTILLTLLLLVGAVGVNAQKTNAKVHVVPVQMDADAAHNGVVYALPQTVIRVRVEAEVAVKKTGPYYRFSQKYLNLSQVVKEDEVTWEIKQIRFSGVAIPHPDWRYKVTAEGKVAAAMINLTGNGILQGVQLSGPTAEWVQPVADLQVVLPEVNFDEVPLGEEILTKTSSAAMAEETAYAIYRLRKKRIELLGGELGAKDAPALQTALAELDRLEQAYLSLFAGKIHRQTVVRYFDYIPDPASPESSVLFRFSAQNGFADRMDLNGTPVYIEAKPLGFKAYAELPAGAKRPAELNGLRYVIPGTVLVRVIDRNKPLAEQQMSVAQMGQVATLPAAWLQQPDVSIRFCPVSGALLQISQVLNNQ